MKNYSVNEVWLIASFTILLFIPLLFIALSDQSRRHVNFKKTISNEPLNKKCKIR